MASITPQAKLLVSSGGPSPLAPPATQGITLSTAQAKHLHPRGQPPPSSSLGLSSGLHLRPPPHLGSPGLVILRHEHIGSLVPCPQAVPSLGAAPSAFPTPPTRAMRGAG